MATISITLSREISRKVRPPRAIYPGFPIGHPLGYPGQIFRHLQILRLLLKYLEKIESPGTIVELDLAGHNDPAIGFEKFG
jgi:hypothetical protein